ncbi:MAG: molybdenum cofactor guanylyltransferase MobA [Thiotrichaceae bacterium]
MQFPITGVILAGGRATRMGGEDKGLVKWQDKCLIQHVIHALHPHVSTLLINANRNLERYQEITGLPIITDIIADYPGPLAGIATGLQHAATEHVLFVPCDSPFIPVQLVPRLYQAMQQQHAHISTVILQGRLQPVFALMQRSLLPDLLAFLQTGQRKVEIWYRQHPLASVDFSNQAEYFINLNNPMQLAACLRPQAHPDSV